MLPGVLTIQDYRNHSIAPRLQHRPSVVFDATNEVLGRLSRRHSGINKADQIREAVIAEDQVHRVIVLLVAIDVVELFRAPCGQTSLVVALEVSVDGAAEDAFVGGHPLNTQLAGELDGLIGEASLRGPDALWTNGKHALMQMEGALKLFPRILRMPKRLPGQGNIRSADPANVAGAKQWKDRMIEGGRRNLDDLPLRRGSILRQHRGQNFPLYREHGLLIRRGEASSLPHQLSNFWTLHEEFI